MGRTCGTTPLTRDFSKALATMEKDLPNLHPVAAITLEQASKHNGIYLFSSVLKAKQIPSGAHWRWNQTKSRQSAQLNDTKVSFYKLIPRKLPQFPKFHKLPVYKIWIFHLNDKQTVLWCQQGEEKNISDRVPFPIVFPRLEQLEFLKEFMQPAVSSELWPKINSPCL